MDRLDKFLLKELLEIGKQLGLAIKAGIKKNELKELIEKDIESKENTDIAWGTLEVLPDGYGFLRGTSVEKDIYVSASQVRKFKLRTEDRVVGEVREPSGDEKNYALKKVLLVNDGTLEAAEARVPFEELIPAYPTEKFILETDSKNISGRIIDLIAPIGRGQRALIIAPPKAGKTMLISNLANSIMKTSKDAEVWILLIDERPEEVTDIKENVIGAQVFASTFDEDPKNHIKVTESILERAKRKVENGENIVILMDSLTRLARAYNIVIPSSGKLISGGIDPTALYYPKNFFGTARNIRGGGSLTIIATVLVDRNLAELRLFPAIEIQRSGTRKEELLIPKKELESIWKIRRHLAKFDKAESLKRLVDTLKSTQSNKSMLEQFEKGVGDEK